jgi:hypothetical protein
MKGANVHRNFQKINAKADAWFEGDVENLWKKLTESQADEVCGRTKDPPRHT